MLVTYLPEVDDPLLTETELNLEVTVEVDGRRSDPYSLNSVREKIVLCKIFGNNLSGFAFIF